VTQTNNLNNVVKLLTIKNTEDDFGDGGSPPILQDIPRKYLKRSNVFNLERTYNVGYANPSTTVDTSGSITASLNLLNDYTEFTALFDSYRILRLDVDFIPVSSVTPGAPLFTVIDYDDATILGSLGAFLEYGDVLAHSQSGRKHSRTLAPRAALSAYNGTFTSFAHSMYKQWFDCASPGVQFYGLKYIIPALASNSPTLGAYMINVRYTLQFCSER